MIKWTFKLPIFLRNPRTSSLGVFSKFNPWETCYGFTCQYSLNIYVGCSFNCLYCYARSYISRFHPDFSKPAERKRFRERLRKSVRQLSNYMRMPISISNSTDPYQPIERVKRHTRYALTLLREYGFPVLITTKSPLVTRDVDILSEMDCIVSLTITTLSDRKALILEPKAPKPSERLKAAKKLVSSNIKTVVRIDPIVPGWNSGEEELDALMEALSDIGVSQVATSIVKVRGDFKILLERKYAENPEYRGDLTKIIDNLKYFRRRAHGYFLIDELVGRRILMGFAELADKHSLPYSFCMENLPFKADTCNGIHHLSCWKNLEKKLSETYKSKLDRLRDEYSLKEYLYFQSFIKKQVDSKELKEKYGVNEKSLMI